MNANPETMRKKSSHLQLTCFERDWRHYHAVIVRWESVKKICGPHKININKIAEKIIREGAPVWVRYAGGWMSKDGVGFIGEEVKSLANAEEERDIEYLLEGICNAG